MTPVCDVCKRGREACEYCKDVSAADWRAMCDCGLYDFGGHLTMCEDRASFRYVIACDYETAMLPR